MTAWQQETLFDFDTSETPEIDPDTLEEPDAIDWDELDQYAFLYTATEKGNSTGVKFMATIPDAQAWCASKESQGQLRGVRWAYYWTSVKNYAAFHWGLTFGDTAHSISMTKRDKHVLDLSKEKDNGQWDERIAASGCRKIGFVQMREILAQFGIDVKIPATARRAS